MAEREGLGGASKRLALKLLHRDYLDDPKRRAMFLSEARLAMLLTNSNIVQVFDVGESDAGMVYMAMEWVEGLDLATLERRLWAEGERLPLALTAYVVGELLKALACAHDFVHDGETRAIIHRDVTPHNVMVSIWGEVKLMDFGVARMASENTSGVHAKGKLRYMPPEQLVGQARAPTIDLFAVGAILHELLDSRGFRDGIIDETRLLGMVVRGEVDDLREPGCVPVQLDALRRGLLHPSAAARIQSARGAHRELREWPGYGDAKFELEALVRRLNSTPAPAGLDEAPTKVVKQGGDVIGSNSRTLTIPPGPAVDASTGELDRRDSESLPTNTLVVLSPSQRTRWRALALLSTLASVAIALGVGLWTFARRPAYTPLPAMSVLVDTALPSEHTPTIVPWRESPTREIPDDSAEIDPNSVDLRRSNTNQRSDGPRRGRRSQPKASKPKPPLEPPPAAVVVRAPQFFYVELKIGRQTLTLDNAATDLARLKLRPGNYDVEFRVDPDASWRSAGQLELAPNESVAIVLGPDGAMEVRR